MGIYSNLVGVLYDFGWVFIVGKEVGLGDDIRVGGGGGCSSLEVIFLIYRLPSEVTRILSIPLIAVFEEKGV